MMMRLLRMVKRERVGGFVYCLDYMLVVIS